MALPRTRLSVAGVLATTALVVGVLHQPHASSTARPSPHHAAAVDEATKPCGRVLLNAASWLKGAGVNVYSNGAKEGTQRSCAPKGSYSIDGLPTTPGAEWKATELVNRLYLTRGWTTDLWPGTGGDGSPLRRDSMFYDPPDGLGRQAEGSIASVAPGDSVFVNEYNHGSFVPGGDALIVNSAGTLTGGRIPLVSQNSGNARFADPESTIDPVLRGGNLVFTSPKGDAIRYVTIGVVHAPRPRPKLANVKSVVAGNSRYCALRTDGGVDCWGFGLDGGLGNGATFESAFPVAVEGLGDKGLLSGVSTIVSDGEFCALLASGGVDCWGTAVSPYPVAVEGVGGSGVLSGATSLVAGNGGFCAVRTSGSVDCWGYGNDGELGNGSDVNSAFPVTVEGVGGAGSLTGVASIAYSGYGSYCARLASGGVDCWGYGLSGQLGDGADTSSAFPVAVEGVGGAGSLSGVTALEAGDAGYCGLLGGGGVDCWGDGYAGELGNGHGASSPFPVAVDGVGGVGSLSGVTSLAASELGYCAVASDGGVDCWGWGYDGELGNGVLTASFAPVAVAGVGGTGVLSGVAALDSTTDTFYSFGRYCAVLVSGRVDCWGDGRFGGLGDGADSTSSVPVAVKGVRGAGLLSGVASLADGSTGGTCALLTSGTVDCWGSNGDGALGSGYFWTFGRDFSATPVVVVLPQR